MKYRVTHSTRYGYEEAIPLSHNVVRMKPREHETQTCLQYQLLVLPSPTVKSEGFDYFGNHVTWFSLQEPHTVLRIAAQSEVEVLPSGPCDVNQGPTWEQTLQILTLAPDREILGRARICFRIASCALVRGVGRIRPFLLFGRAAVPCVRSGFDPAHPRRVQISGGLDGNRYTSGGSFSFAPGRVPGLRSSTDKLPALAWIFGAIRQRIFGHFSPAGKRTAHRRGYVACVDWRFRAGHGLGGIRPHERADAERRAHHARLGKGLRRCRPIQRRSDRRPAPLDGCLRGCCAHRTFLNVSLKMLV